MLNIIRFSLWLGLTDKQIDFLMDIYCRLKYKMSFKEILSIMSELEKDA